MKGSTLQKRKRLKSGDWSGVVQFSTNQGSMHVVRSKYVIVQFSYGLHCLEHRF